MYEVAVPAILLAIMISMGMELSLADFRRVVEMPRATLIGLAGQMLLLPVAGLAFAHWPGFTPTIAMGIVIVAACPGGATSNLFSYLARANVALSVTLTSLSSTLCFVTIPFWIGLGLDLFLNEAGGETAPIDLPVGRMVVQLFVLSLLPVAIGMGIRARWPEFSARIRTRLRRAMTALMAGALVIIVGSEWESVVRDLRDASAAALMLVTGMLLVSYAGARASQLDDRDAFTISIEVGLQNGALATTVVVALLERPELVVFPGAYAVLSFIPVVAWTFFMRRRVVPDAMTADPEA